MSLIPAPWALAVKIGLPILAVVGAFTAGDIHGTRGTTARLTAKYQPALERAKAALDLSAERIRRARAEASAADLAHARAVETAQAKASQETEIATLNALDIARADAARHASRLRAPTGNQAAGGGGVEPHLPYAPIAIADLAPIDQKTELDDAVACAEAVTIAEGWQALWRKISETPK